MRQIALDQSIPFSSPYVICKIEYAEKGNNIFKYKIKIHKSHKIKGKWYIANSSPKNNENIIPLIDDPDLHDGDILEITDNNCIFVQVNSKSDDNSIIVNNHCNENCINCPQSNHEKNDSLRKKNELIIDFFSKDISRIGLTGGEPTLDIDYLISLILKLYSKNPNIHIDLLTNGLTLSNIKNVQKLNKILYKNILFCIALYADIPSLHDKHTLVQGSFEKTIQAIHNLTLFKQKIELRFVINKLNYLRLNSFIEFVYENFPFIQHLSLMGMEYSGIALSNIDYLYINVQDYARILESSVKKAKQRGVKVFIYNHPLCILSKSLWRVCVPSISLWKVGYMNECFECDLIGICGGFFTTTKTEYQPIGINAINLDTDKRITGYENYKD